MNEETVDTRQLAEDIITEFDKRDILPMNIFIALWMCIEAYISVLSGDDKDLEKVRESLSVMTTHVLNNLSQSGWK